MTTKRWFPVAACAGLAVLAFVVYGNTFGVPFLLDDIIFIVESESIRSLSFSFLGHGWTGPNWIDFRPVADLSFRLNYQISGLDVWSYHLVNICIHAASAVLLYLVLRNILATRLSPWWSQAAALASAAVWVVHPININAVTYISQRFESLAAMFALAGLLAFLRSRISGQKNGDWWCLLFVLLSFGSKLSNLALPVLIWLLDRFDWPKGVRDPAAKSPFFVLLVSTWLFAAWLFSAREDWTRSIVEGAARFSFDNLKIQSTVIMYYCGKLVWPARLVFDEGKWPSPTAWEWLPAAIILSAVFIWSVLAVFRRNLAAFAVVSFFLLLGPSSSFVVVPSYDAADYRMYLPSACFIALALGSFAWLLSKRGGRVHRIIFAAVTIVLVICLASVTWRRNQIYNSPTDLWSDNAAKRPLHSGSYVGVGEALMREGRLAEAETTLSYARSKFSDNARLLNLSGMVAMQDGREIAAIGFWRRAHELAPENHVILSNLAISAFRSGDIAQASDLFGQVVSLRPRDVIALGNLAQVRILQGNLDEAQELVRRGLQVLPQDSLMLSLQERIDTLLLKSDRN